MPLQTPPKPLVPERVVRFVGVNLRQDALDSADTDVVRAINWDFQRTPGIPQRRWSARPQFSTPLTPATPAGTTRLVYLWRFNDRRYQYVDDDGTFGADGTLYRDQVPILSGIVASTRLSMQSFQTLSDLEPWVYMMPIGRKDNGTVVYQWGIAAPNFAPTVSPTGSGPLTGDYSARFTYARRSGGVLIQESNPSPVSSTVTLSSDNLQIGITQTGDPQVTDIGIYRTVSSGAQHFFDQWVPNVTGNIISSIPDAALGGPVETDNHTPSSAGVSSATWITEYQGHIMLCGLSDVTERANQLYFSKRFQEAIPADNFIEIGPPVARLQAMYPIGGALGVFSRDTKYRVVGNEASGFVPSESVSVRGLAEPKASVMTRFGVAFAALDGIFLTDFLSADTPLSDLIQSLFTGETLNGYAPIDWSRSYQMSMAFLRNRLYFAYPTTTPGENLLAVYSFDTQRWYFFEYTDQYYAVLHEKEDGVLVAGGANRTVDYLEDAASPVSGNPLATTVTSTLQTAERALDDPFLLKHFQYVRVLCDALSGQLDVSIYVDGTLITTLAVTGSKQAKLLRLPARAIGYTWYAMVSYTGAEAVRIHGIEMQARPARAA